MLPSDSAAKPTRGVHHRSFRAEQPERRRNRRRESKRGEHDVLPTSNTDRQRAWR